QALRATPARNQTQLDFRQAKLSARLIQRDAVIASQGKLEAAAQARTVDDGQRRHRQAGQFVEELLTAGGQRSRLFRVLDRGELVQVGAGDEARFLGAGDEEQLRRRRHNGIERRVQI